MAELKRITDSLLQYCLCTTPVALQRLWWFLETVSQQGCLFWATGFYVRLFNSERNIIGVVDFFLLGTLDFPARVFRFSSRCFVLHDQSAFLTLYAHLPHIPLRPILQPLDTHGRKKRYSRSITLHYSTLFFVPLLSIDSTMILARSSCVLWWTSKVS
jgi:hypothetical protein